MQNRFVRKGFVLGIIILFVVTSGIPSMGGTIFKKNGLQDNKASFIGLTPFGNILYVGGTGSDNYTRIQDAIDNATESDTVFVFDDSSPYYENLVVNKSINLIGEDKNTTIINGSLTATDVIEITSDCVNLTGFLIINGTNGIQILSNHNTINNNKIINNRFYGIDVDYTCYNVIIGNNISSNSGGIRLWKSNNTFVIENEIFYNIGNYICFGIIAMFIILAINPSINVIADPEYITVVTYRWDEATNEIVNQEEEWLIEDYNNFNDKFELCNTFEDCFYVFQEFNFIPANQTISEFMDWSQNLYSENEEIVQENLSEFHVELPEQQNNFFNGFGVWMEGSVQGLMADLYMPVVFYLIYSENGGQVHYIADSPINGPSEATWEGDYWFSFWIGWIGLIVPRLTQFVTIWDITFTGICLYAEFTIV